MKKFLLGLLFLLMPFSLSMAQETEEESLETSLLSFQKYALNQLNLMPNLFEGVITGKDIKKTLDKSEVQLLDETKPATVKAYYKRSKGLEFKVENVELFYEDLFVWYAKQVNQILYPLIFVDRNVLSDYYQLVKKEEDKKNDIFYLTRLYSDPSVTLVFYIDRETSQIDKVLYQINDESLIDLSLEYEAVDDANGKHYSIPNKFNIKVLTDQSIGGRNVSKGSYLLYMSDFKF